MFGSKLKVKTLLFLCIFTYLILSVTLTSAGSVKVDYQKRNYDKIVAIVVKECKSYKNVPPEVILAIISKESGFNSNATHNTKSGTQYLGAMQINNRTAKTLWKHFYSKEKFDIKRFLQPEVNIKLGIWHFNNILTKYRSNVEMALTVYNKGAGGYKKLMASRGTYVSSYSRSIMMLSKRYKVNK